MPKRTKAIRKLVTVAVIVVVAFVGWKLMKRWNRSDANKQLEARQDKARERIGDGLDALFDRLLDDDTTTVELSAQFDVARELGAGYEAFKCGYGFEDAFKDALGPDVVTFSTSPWK